MVECGFHCYRIHDTVYGFLVYHNQSVHDIVIFIYLSSLCLANGVIVYGVPLIVCYSRSMYQAPFLVSGVSISRSDDCRQMPKDLNDDGRRDLMNVEHKWTRANMR